MQSFSSDQETKIIQYLRRKDPRGCKLLLKYYSAPLYGIINRIIRSPLRADEVLIKSFEKICANIEKFTAHDSTFFIWMMQEARKLSIEEISTESNGPIESKVDRADNVVSLVMDRGFSLAQAAAVLKVTVQQVAIDLRIGLKQRR